MTQNELVEQYFEWMYQLVCNDESIEPYYRKLLFHLNNIEFTYSISMDGNRAEDGVGLRYRFGYELGHPHPIIASYLDYRSCSVLEMLVALALRCEEHIMADPEFGNRTGQWFWIMISNLGLGNMYDANFDDITVDETIERFLNREYRRNGEGGLFTIEHCKHDLRAVEIWYQMCWYLSTLV